MAVEPWTCPRCGKQNAGRTCTRCTDRSINASIASNARWSREPNRSRATAAARAAGPNGIEYFLRQVDPDGEMTDADRYAMAENARREYFRRLGKAARRAKTNPKPAA